MIGIIVPLIGLIIVMIESSRKSRCTRESIEQAREHRSDTYFDYSKGVLRYMETGEVCVVLFKADGNELVNPKTGRIIRKDPPLNPRSLHRAMTDDEWAISVNETYKKIGEKPPYVLNKEGHYERKVRK